MRVANGVHAVVVTYWPDLGRLRDLLNSMAGQVDRIHLIDNTPGESDLESIEHHFEKNSLEIVRLYQNIGIASAFNLGISRALDQYAEFVLLSDQDSLPAPTMVAELLSPLRARLEVGEKVAAIGPIFTDETRLQDSKYQVEVPGKLFYRLSGISGESSAMEVITLISSGTLIPVSALSVVGPMKDDFFIDCVDWEWCHRARFNGYKIFVASGARMVHRMGSEQTKVWFMGWRVATLYPPERTYYVIRNCIALAVLPYVPLPWKVRNIWYWLGFLYTQFIFGKKRISSLKMAINGFLDAARRISGPYDSSR